MTVFTKKEKAKSKVAIGNTRIKVATRGRGTLGDKISNKDRLKMTRGGVKLKLEGTRELNKIKAKKRASSQKPFLATN